MLREASEKTSASMRLEKFRFKDYVSPLVAEGLIMLTIPDKPKSPRQKYVTTEKGRQSTGAKENKGEE